MNRIINSIVNVLGWNGSKSVTIEQNICICIVCIPISSTSQFRSARLTSNILAAKTWLFRNICFKLCTRFTLSVVIIIGGIAMQLKKNAYMYISFEYIQVSLLPFRFFPWFFLRCFVNHFIAPFGFGCLSCECWQNRSNKCIHCTCFFQHTHT